MNNLSNINIKGLSKKLKIKGGLAMLGLATVMSVTSCSKIENQTMENSPIKVEDVVFEKITVQKIKYDESGNEICSLDVDYIPWLKINVEKKTYDLSTDNEVAYYEKLLIPFKTIEKVESPYCFLEKHKIR